MHYDTTLVLEASASLTHRAFHEMVEQYKQSVYYLAMDLTGNHHDAEDLSQDVFIKAYRAMDQFRGEASMMTWLRRITVNTYLNRRRKKALSFMRFFGDVGTVDRWQDALPMPDRNTEGSLMKEHVEEALKALSPRERSAFVLRFYQDLAVKDVAETMGCAEGTVKSLLYRATQKLQKALSFYRTDLGLTG